MSFDKENSNFDDVEDYKDSSLEDDSDKNNIDSSSTKRKRSSRRTDAQFDVLKSNVPEKTQSTSLKTKAWQVLAGRLNTMGHPIHVWSDWRRLWCDYKARNKRQKIGEDDYGDDGKDLNTRLYF